MSSTSTNQEHMRPRKSNPKSTTLRVLEYLMAHGDTDAGSLGSAIWRDRKRGRVCSVNGGGDYAMQMLLGRLRTRQLVKVANGEGASRWYITALGREHVALGIA